MIKAAHIVMDHLSTSDLSLISTNLFLPPQVSLPTCVNTIFWLKNKQTNKQPPTNNQKQNCLNINSGSISISNQHFTLFPKGSQTLA